LFNELDEWKLLIVRENGTKNITVKRCGKGKKENSDYVITLEKISGS